jgi:ABC-type multidrug transport system ATPase subunit
VALANKPQLLLADEPTGEVDSATALTIYKTFQTLNRELGVTTLIVSHDPGIARHVDRVIAIRDGRLAAETVRQARRKVTLDSYSDEPEHFEELIVLDAAGRLQVPKDYLARFNIKGRVQLEVREDGILIRPVEQTDHAEDAEALATDLAQAKQGRGLRGVFQRRRNGRG